MADKVVFYTPDHDTKIAGLYDLEHTIGRGHYAVVKLARHVFTGEKVAVKVIDKTKLDDISQDHLFQEVVCMKLVQHPNVIRLYEVIDTPAKLYLILELGDGGDLYDYITRHGCGLHETIARRYFRQIVTAIAYCHKLHVVHRDLKPENVVFFEKLGLVKLTDFGFSNRFTPGMNLDTACGSLAYSAPEILMGDPYDAPKVDIWSLGVILYMLVCGRLPFQGPTDSETLTKIMDCDYTIPDYVSPECRHLISRLLIRDPEKRALLDDILQAEWLNQGNEDRVPIELISIPLVSKECLSFEDHMEILSKMSEGQLATVEEIQSTLDRNEYNHIAATYFLLAERKLKRKYIEEYKLLTQQAQMTEWLRQQHLQQNQQQCLSELGGSFEKGRNLQYNECSGKVVLPSTVSAAASRLIGAAVPVSSQCGDERIRRFSMILEDEEEEEEVERKSTIFSRLSRFLPGPYPSVDAAGTSVTESENARSDLIESVNEALLEEEEELMTVSNLASVRLELAEHSVLPSVDETREFSEANNFTRPCSRASISAVEISDGAESDASLSNWSTATNSFLGSLPHSSLARSLLPSELRRRSHYRRAMVPHRPLVTVKSSPQLLKHIAEEDWRAIPNGVSKRNSFENYRTDHAPKRSESLRRPKQPSSEDGEAHSYHVSLYGHRKLMSFDDQLIGVRSRRSWTRQRPMSTTHSPTRTKRLFTSTMLTSRPTSIGSWSAAFNMSLLNEFRRRSVCSSPVENLNGSIAVRRKPPNSQSQSQVPGSRNPTNDRRCSGPPSLAGPTFSPPKMTIGSPIRLESDALCPDKTNPILRIRNHSESDNLGSEHTSSTSAQTNASRSSTSVPILDNMTDNTLFDKSLPSGASAFSTSKKQSLTTADNRSPNRTWASSQRRTLTRSPNRSFSLTHTPFMWSSSTPLLYDYENVQNTIDVWNVGFSATSMGTTVPLINGSTAINSCAAALRESCAPIREEEDEMARAGDTNHANMQNIDPEFFSRRSSTDSVTQTDSTRSNCLTVVSTSTSLALPDRSRPVTRLTASNFSLSSLAACLLDSKHMIDIIRGTFELQCHYNRRTIGSFTGGGSSGYPSGHASTSVSVRSLTAVSESHSMTMDHSTDLPESSRRFPSVRMTIGNEPLVLTKFGRRPLSSRRSTLANGPVGVRNEAVYQNPHNDPALLTKPVAINTSPNSGHNSPPSHSPFPFNQRLVHNSPFHIPSLQNNNELPNQLKSFMTPERSSTQEPAYVFHPSSSTQPVQTGTSISLVGFDRDGDLRVLTTQSPDAPPSQNPTCGATSHAVRRQMNSNSSSSNTNHPDARINNSNQLSFKSSKSSRFNIPQCFSPKQKCCTIC